MILEGHLQRTSAAGLGGQLIQVQVYDVRRSDVPVVSSMEQATEAYSLAPLVNSRGRLSTTNHPAHPGWVVSRPTSQPVGFSPSTLHPVQDGVLITRSQAVGSLYLTAIQLQRHLWSDMSRAQQTLRSLTGLSLPRALCDRRAILQPRPVSRQIGRVNSGLGVHIPNSTGMPCRAA